MDTRDELVPTSTGASDAKLTRSPPHTAPLFLLGPLYPSTEHDPGARTASLSGVLIVAVQMCASADTVARSSRWISF